MKKWKTLESKLAFDNKWFRVQQDTVELPSGKVLDDYFLYLEGIIGMVVPVTVEGKIILVKQYKHGVKDLIIECPAGWLNEGEDSLEGTKRELAEETGFIGDKWDKIGEFSEKPTKIIGKTVLFLAQDLQKNPEIIHNDETEEIEVLEKGWNEVFKMINLGEINASMTIAAIYLAAEKLGVIKH